MKKSKPAAKRKASVRPITDTAGDPSRLTPIERIGRETAAAAKLDLTNLKLSERAFLATCQEIYRADIGCYTPFESFFADIVRWTMWGNTPTLDTIRAELAEGSDGEFLHNWNPMLQGVKRFIQNYPDLIAEIQNAAKSEAEQPAEAAHA